MTNGQGMTCAAVLVGCGEGAPLEMGTVVVPPAGPGEVLIRVRAAGVNRADIDQRRGEYPPPPGASPILGLEVAGEVVALGEGVSELQLGDRVLALVQGGGYAELCVAPVETTLRAPARLDFLQAAAVPEAYFTVWSNVFMIAGLRAGETFLVHGGTSGVGSAAIQIAKSMGAVVIATARSAAKCEACRSLGADLAINYVEEDFAAVARSFTGGAGVDVILDLVGAVYLERNLSLLRRNGRLALIDSRSGDHASIDLGTVIVRNLMVTGSVLRPRPLEEKKAIARCVAERLLPRLASGEITPLIAEALPLARAGEAHRILEESTHIGKVVLEVGRG